LPHALDVRRLLRRTRISCRLGSGSRLEVARPRRWLLTRCDAVDAPTAPGAGSNDVPRQEPHDDAGNLRLLGRANVNVHRRPEPVPMRERPGGAARLDDEPPVVLD